MNWSDIFKSREWMSLKTENFKTDKVLSRIEFVQKFGAKNFSADKYQDYLRLYGNNSESTSEESLNFEQKQLNINETMF
jgi:hypothetical protein